MSPKYLLPLLIFALCFITTDAIGQHPFRFADSTAKWHFVKTQYPQTPPPILSKWTETYRYIKDTTINGLTYNFLRYDNWEVFVRQDSSGKVYHLDYNNQEHLVFDFGLKVGDTIAFDQSQTGIGSYSLRVDSVDSVNIGGLKKRLFLECVSGDCHIAYDNERWVEGIGFFNTSTYGEHPFARRAIADAPSIKILCYSEHDTTYYKNDEYNTCNHDTSIHLSVQDISKGRIKLYPNPTNNALHISFPSSSSAIKSISLVDITGRHVLRKQPATAKQQTTFQDK